MATMRPTSCLLERCVALLDDWVSEIEELRRELVDFETFVSKGHRERERPILAGLERLTQCPQTARRAPPAVSFRSKHEISRVYSAGALYEPRLRRRPEAG